MTLRNIWEVSRFQLWSISESIAGATLYICLEKWGIPSWASISAGLAAFVALNIIELKIAAVRRPRSTFSKLIVDVLRCAGTKCPSENSAEGCPPKTARFLLLLVPIKSREHLFGDLEEEYRTVLVPEFGVRVANRWYWEQVLASILPLLFQQMCRLAGVLFLWRISR